MGLTSGDANGKYAYAAQRQPRHKVAFVDSGHQHGLCFAQRVSDDLGKMGIDYCDEIGYVVNLLLADIQLFRDLRDNILVRLAGRKMRHVASFGANQV